MKNSFHHYIYYIIFVGSFVILPFLTHSCFVNSGLHDEIEERIHMLDSLRTIQKANTLRVDSLSYYFNQIEQMHGEILLLRDHYANDVNLMIQKTDAWMAYWIGIFAIVMAIPSILFSLHYYHSYENWEKKNKQQKKELDSEIEKIQKELQELIKEKDAALKENESVRNDLKDKFIKTEKEYDNLLEEKLNKYNVELNKKILKIKKTVDIETDKLKKSFRENRINTIMMCLSSFPDPQMVAEKEDKRIMVSDYLQLLYNEYSKYAQIVSILITQEKDDHYEETLKYVRLVLLSIKMAIIRSQSSFSELTQNIACHVLIRIIDSTTKDIASGKIPYTQLKDNLDKVLTSFLQVISYIKE